MIHFELYALRGDGWTLDSWHDDEAGALARAEAARARAGCRGVKVIRETYYPRRHAAQERVILDTTRRRRPKPARPPAPAAVPAPPPSGARNGPTWVAASLVGVASVAAVAAATAAVIALT